MDEPARWPTAAWILQGGINGLANRIASDWLAATLSTPQLARDHAWRVQLFLDAVVTRCEHRLQTISPR
jgi:hypothetical protein